MSPFSGNKAKDKAASINEDPHSRHEAKDKGATATKITKFLSIFSLDFPLFQLMLYLSPKHYHPLAHFLHTTRYFLNSNLLITYTTNANSFEQKKLSPIT
jgi:hypothetical protein